MTKRQWSVVIVPHGAGDSRSLRVSLRAVKVVATAAVLLMLATAGMGYTVIARAVDLSQLERIERRNALLAGELSDAATLVSALNDTVRQLALRDEQIRLLAGLEPTNPEVLLAGIGGPASWTEDDQLLSEGPTGRDALDLRATLDGLVRRAGLLATSYQEAVDSLGVHRDRLSRTPSISPIPPSLGWFTSGFASARRHPIFNEERPHPGIDVSAPMGTEILAPASGRVVDVRVKTGYGRTVTIDHGFGVVTMFAHCSRITARVGQWVERGDKIAEVGNTGIATGPHLHYEVAVDGRQVDPRTFIFPTAIVD